MIVGQVRHIKKRAANNGGSLVTVCFREIAESILGADSFSAELEFEAQSPASRDFYITSAVTVQF